MKLELGSIKIENRIYSIRGLQVMVDFHLSEVYEVEKKRINEQVKRNSKRFPIGFMFQLSDDEWGVLQSQIETAEKQFNLQSQFATTKRRTNIRAKNGLLFLKWIKTQ